ncbi:MAG: phosphatidylglycerol lysyltransferase domain-containing protein [Nitrospirota bacterium]|nr:phosphatidylglycerol lysyltransferase domain-containing protein [Nitrospirota bacterium]
MREGLSEFTFANIYLFRNAHDYKIAAIDERLYVITGREREQAFFMLPFGLPEEDMMDVLFSKFDFMRHATENQAGRLAGCGYMVHEDRSNFDYLYSREELASLSGRKFHKKKNLVNAFVGSYSYEGRPLLDEYKADALWILDEWRRERPEPGDYEAAKEALVKSEELELCGGIYYVEGKPAAYTLGEELAGGETFVIHFEKGVSGYKGLYQFVNQCFASILPEKYIYINREQDLGDEGLRQAKMSYKPVEFVKKYRVTSRRGPA